jgi:hypothetical protein
VDRVRGIAPVGLLVVALAACGSGDDDAPGGSTSTPTIAIPSPETTLGDGSAGSTNEVTLPPDATQPPPTQSTTVLQPTLPTEPPFPTTTTVVFTLPTELPVPSTIEGSNGTTIDEGSSAVKAED